MVGVPTPSLQPALTDLFSAASLSLQNPCWHSAHTRMSPENSCYMTLSLRFDIGRSCHSCFKRRGDIALHLLWTCSHICCHDKCILKAHIRQQICRHPAKRYNTKYYYQQYSYKYSKRLFTLYLDII